MSYPWQQLQWQNIQQQRQQEKLPHALLLIGNEGMGKLDFARHMAHGLLCTNPQDSGSACGECASCKLIHVGNHPDLYVLQAEERGRAIKVDEVRQLTSKLSLTSQYSGYKVALIVDAHDMNINASNSLLKTLEEPARETVLILVSSQPARLPITIRSRCQLIHFRLPDKQQALDWLQSQWQSMGKSLDVQHSQQLLALAHGAPLLALELQQGELPGFHKQLISSLLAVAQRQPVIEQAETLYKLPLNYLLNWLYDWVQDLILLHQCGENAQIVHNSHQTDLLNLVRRTDLPGLYSFLEQLLKQKQLQSIPLNAQLLWEDLLLSWYKILK